MDAPVDDFKKAMKRAIEDRDRLRVPVFHFDGTRRYQPKAGGGMSTQFLDALDAERRPTMEQETGLLRHLENNVDMDIEMGKLVKNAGRHNMMASILAQQFGMLREAISERVSA
jgi:flagellar basal body rod protein FlgB